MPRFSYPRAIAIAALCFCSGGLWYVAFRFLIIPAAGAFA